MATHFTIKSLLGGIAQLLLFPLALFLAAGTVFWLAGWIFLILLYGFVVATVLLLSRQNPGLLEERMSIFKSDQKNKDNMFLPLLAVSIVWLILMPLDAVRFHWSHVPIWLQVVGALALICSFALMYLSFRENAYLTPTVRIQKERGHTVVSTGPYHYVRHPMYSGFVLFFMGMALLLGSAFGFFLALLLVWLFAWRAVQEENLLREELPGYDTYMVQVHYRFIPHVW
jgi:protein-S-isoprenylcysteine O-methyltransferase Ste14